MAKRDLKICFKTHQMGIYIHGPHYQATPTSILVIMLMNTQILGFYEHDCEKHIPQACSGKIATSLDFPSFL